MYVYIYIYIYGKILREHRGVVAQAVQLGGANDDGIVGGADVSAGVGLLADLDAQHVLLVICMYYVVIVSDIVVLLCLGP